MFSNLLQLALPIVCQNLITYGVTMADNLMIGRLGEAAINGLFMASIVQLVFQMVLLGVESAMVVLSTQYWGKGDIKRIKDVIAITFRTTLIFSLIASPLIYIFSPEILSFLTSSEEAAKVGASYLRIISFSLPLFSLSMILVGAMRSVEIVKIGLINSIAALIVNGTLNYLLIFGAFGFPKLGVEGAAIATVISRVVELAIVLCYVLKLDKRISMSPGDLICRFDRSIACDLVKYGTPLLMGQFVWAVNKFTMRHIVGHFEPSSAAAVSISETLDGLLWVGTFGFASAMGVITGRMIGAGEYDKVKLFAKRMQLFFIGVGIFSFAIVMLCGDLFISLYTLTNETKEIAKVFLIVLAFSVLGRAYQAPCLMGLVKAGGDTSFVFKNDSFWVFCWVLPSALIAWKYFHAPDYVVYSFLLSDQITKCFVAAVKINRFKWMKNLTRG